jgi:hypothetical protein
MKNDKTSLTKVEKNRIKDAHPTETYTDEEWAILQGMTHSEFQSPTELSVFYDEVDEKIDFKKDSEYVRMYGEDEESHIVPITLDDDGELMVTFPDELMDSLNWKAGDVVEWVDGGNGEWIVRKST